jgi:hypothetical protein
LAACKGKPKRSSASVHPTAGRTATFIGNNDAGEVNASFVSLLASCQLHGIEPWGYLRDLFCLVPSWPSRRILELAPVCWRQTVERAEVRERLANDIFRWASLNQPRPAGTSPLASVG